MHLFGRAEEREEEGVFRRGGKIVPMSWRRIEGMYRNVEKSSEAVVKQVAEWFGDAVVFLVALIFISLFLQLLPSGLRYKRGLGFGVQLYLGLSKGPGASISRRWFTWNYFFFFLLKKNMPEDSAHVLRIKGAGEDRTRSPSGHSCLGLLEEQLQRKRRNYVLKGLRKWGPQTHGRSLYRTDTPGTRAETPCLPISWIQWGATTARGTLPSSPVMFWRIK